MSLHPADIMFDPRIIRQRFNGNRDRWIGFCCSALAHISILAIAGMVFIKPVQFGVDLGFSGMEVQLVAAPQEASVVPEKDALIQEKIKEPKPVITPQKVNASSSIQGAITEAKPFYLQNPAPKYPLSARQNGWEGLVLLKVLVDKNGYPLKIEVEKSSGHSVLDEAAFKAVKTWRFHPAQLGKIPIESSVRVPVRFKLDGLLTSEHN